MGFMHVWHLHSFTSRLVCDKAGWKYLHGFIFKKNNKNQSNTKTKPNNKTRKTIQPPLWSVEREIGNAGWERTQIRWQNKAIAWWVKRAEGNLGWRTRDSGIGKWGYIESISSVRVTWREGGEWQSWHEMRKGREEEHRLYESAHETSGRRDIKKTYVDMVAENRSNRWLHMHSTMKTKNVQFF